MQTFCVNIFFVFCSLAIGVADKSIRVVNTNEQQLKTMQTFTQKVSGKVMSLSWHPSKDGWLAYGRCNTKSPFYL